jgi:hypothetical protein
MHLKVHGKDAPNCPSDRTLRRVINDFLLFGTLCVFQPKTRNYLKGELFCLNLNCIISNVLPAKFQNTATTTHYHLT